MALAFIAATLVALTPLPGNGETQMEGGLSSSSLPSLFFRPKDKTDMPMITPRLTGILWVPVEDRHGGKGPRCWINGHQFSEGEKTPWGTVKEISPRNILLETKTTPALRTLSLQP